jgi:uncharacterized SAM-binding protein YcdF (DUF218 family)/glycosyltransferase involved in cell wall biosynthesis
MNTPLHNIVCISTIDWDFIWQGHQEIMSTLARQGHRVLFIENTGVRNVTLKDLPRLKTRLLNWRRGVRGIRKVMDNLYVYAPLVLPFPYSRVARAINKALMFWTLRSWTRTMRFENPIIWTWLPTPLTLELIEVLDGRLVVYYCCDNFEASSPGSRRVRETEDHLCRTADLVFASSKALFDRSRMFTDQIYLFPTGFNREVFVRAAATAPDDLAHIPRPILGYVGGVHKVIDFELVEKLARAYPEKSLVFVGPIQTEIGRLSILPNVYFLGQKRYEDLPNYIAQFDVCLIPYLLNDYTRHVLPVKLNEYLIMGKPVVSTKLPEVEYFNRTHQEIVAIADNHEAFVVRIADELRRDNESLRATRAVLVEKNAWDKKIDTMSSLIQAKLEEKAKARELNWRDSLLNFYRSSQRNGTLAVSACLIAYAVFFHTPAVWMLAEPLRFEQQPVSADAIVVLAGGIGESGEPGDEYQEKVRYAAELYHQGYADKLIFSSGVWYVFQETQVMKALAVSLGVAESAIILEEVGGGNYASLHNAKAIMESKGWTRMLLVTARYNTSRSHLLAAKNLPAITVSLTPAPHSVFFGNESTVAWKHVRAITHEYLGIIYYWWKGYI